MDQQKRKKWLRLGRLALHSAATYLIFALFSFCAYFLMWHTNYGPYAEYEYLSDSAVYVTCLVLSLVFYHSLIRTDAVQSNTFRARFFSIWDRNDPPGFMKRLKLTLRSPEFLSNLIVHALLVLLFPSAFGYNPLVLLLGDLGNHGMVTLIIIPALALLCLAARLSALSAWSVEWSRKAGKPYLEPISLGKLLLRLFLLPAIFWPAVAVAPMVVRTIYSLYLVLRLANAWILVPVVVGVALLWYLIRLLIAAGKRRRLLRRLRAFCWERGYELLRVKNCIRTLIFPKEGVNFTLQKGETRYDCRLISSLAKYSPLLFREEGTVTCTHILRFFSLNLFHFDFTYDFQFEGTGKKILILLPAPIEVFVSGYGVTQIAASGSRIADCVLYGATDFLNALERDVVGR